MARIGKPSFGLALAVVVGVACLVAPAWAATTGAATTAESIAGRLRGPDGEGVAGVVLSVNRDGAVVGEAVSGGDGSWSVAVLGPGTYAVDLDPASLPEGLALRDPGRRVLDAVEVRPGQTKVVVFPLGEGAGSGRGGVVRLLDLLVDGLKLGSVVAVASVGLSLVFGVTGLVNFAHGELVTFGALVAFLFSSAAAGPGWPLVAGGVLAAVAGGILGFSLERGLWRPLRRRRTSSVALLVISIGLSLLLRHVMLAVFDGAPRQYSQYTIQRPIDIAGVEVLPKELVVVALSVALLVAVGLVLSRSRLGTAVRAVADNPDLAATSGVDVDRVLMATWVGAATLTAVGGVFQGLLQAVVWDMGLTLLLTMFAAVLLGGLGSAYGAMVGGYAVGILSEVSTYWIPVELKSVVALAVLVAVLLFRPQGILGVRERIA